MTFFADVLMEEVVEETEGDHDSEDTLEDSFSVNGNEQGRCLK